MRNVAVLSHIADIDGVGAAALVRMRYRIPLNQIFLISHDRDEVLKAAQGLRRLGGKGLLVFITDLNPSADTMDVYESMVKEIKGRGGSVVWLDHHVWSKEAIRRIPGACGVAIFGENREMCATQIVHRFLELDSRFANEFADNVHYIDLFLPTKNKKYKRRAEEYKLGIDYYLMRGTHESQQNKLRRLAGAISSGRFTDPDLHRAALKFKALNSKRIALLLRNLVYLSPQIVLAFSKQVDSTDACHEMLEKTEADISILIKTDTGHCSIRSRKADTVPLARTLGGGGHPHASGFSVDVRRYNSFKTANGREKFLGAVKLKADKLGLL